MSSTKYGFIGCGNMGGALIRSASKSVQPEDVYITDKFIEKAYEISKETNTVVKHIRDIAKECEYIFLGVKPQGMEQMLSEIKDILNERKDRFVLVTMAAGVKIEQIKKYSGNFPVIRIMPNLNVSVNEGMVLFCSEGVFEDEIETFKNVMKKAGLLCPMEEYNIDAGCALSGSGPAYVFMFIESMADGAVECGLPRNKAIQLAAQTVLGSAKMVLESGKHPDELKDAVCSPAGTTIAGVRALEKGAFRASAADAVIEGYKRAKEL